jgi:hypothetical protein
MCDQKKKDYKANMELPYTSTIRRKTFGRKDASHVAIAKTLLSESARDTTYCFENFKEGILYFVGDEPYAVALWEIEDHIRLWNDVFLEYREMRVHLVYARPHPVPFLDLLLYDIERIGKRGRICRVNIFPISELLKQCCLQHDYVQHMGGFAERMLLKSLEREFPLSASPWRPHVRRRWRSRRRLAKN